MVSHLQATVITQTQGFEKAKPSFQKALEFNQFDPAVGELQAVRVALDLEISNGSLIVDNDRDEPVTVSVQLGAKAQLSSAVPLLDDAASTLFSGSTAVIASTGAIFELAADNGDLATFDPTLPDAEIHEGGHVSISRTGLVGSASFADFKGTDVFEITAVLDQILDFGGVGGVSGQFEPVDVATKVTLTYEYLPVTTIPEPTGLMLASQGCWACGAGHALPDTLRLREDRHGPAAHGSHFVCGRQCGDEDQTCGMR